MSAASSPPWWKARRISSRRSTRRWPAIVHAHLRDKSIELYLDDKIEHFEDRPDHVVVFLASGKRIQADIVVLSIGVRPEVKLARQAGLALGATGGIKVDERLVTSDPDIYAVGDAIEVTHFVSGKPALIPLAGPANRQARIVADNMLASDPAARKRYGGTMGTAILKAFDLVAACTGLNETQAKALEIPHSAIIIHAGSHASYYPGSRQLSLKLVFGLDGRILGAQAIGADGVDKRIDVIATAIKAGLSVQDLTDLELAYAPPFGSAKDPVNVAGYVASNVVSGFQEIIEWRELRDILKSAPTSIQLVDVRTPEEFSIQTLPGARNLELDHLRDRLGELDPGRPVVIFCQVGLRGYLAYRILKQAGLQGRPQPDGRLQDLRLGDRETGQSRPLRLREHQAATAGGDRGRTRKLQGRGHWRRPQARRDRAPVSRPDHEGLQGHGGDGGGRNARNRRLRSRLRSRHPRLVGAHRP